MPSNDLDLPSAKVMEEDRTGVDNWIRFHAAYSRGFAEEALQEIAEPGALVVDPFCGSGTTARAAATVGCKSVSFDLNPALVHLARGTVLSPAHASSIIHSLRYVEGRKATYTDSLNGLTEDWLHEETANDLEYVRRRVRDPRRHVGARYFGEALLVSAARQIIQPDVGSNPTWPKPPEDPSPKDVRDQLVEEAVDLRADLQAFHENVRSSNHSFLFGDAKDLPLHEDSVDGVLTSPPYLSRIDYIKTTLPELLALGYDSSQGVQGLRENLMGGVLTGRSPPQKRSSWGTLTKRTLDRIENHDSKASSTYYSTLAYRYFADLDDAIRETIRILKPGRTALYVVQSSYYKDVPIPLQDILVEIARSHGAKSEVVAGETVRRHLGNLSPHQREYVPDKALEEAVVMIQPGAE